MTHNFNSLVKFGLGLFMAGSASLMLVGCDKAPSGNSSSASRDHLARIKSAGELKVGLEGDWQPFSFHDEKDKLVGYDVEVAQNLAKKLGVKAKIVEGPWDGLFAGMDSGRYDLVINGVDITPERAKTYDFSTPYAYDRTVLITRSDNNDIHSFNDLKGKTTANSIGSTYQEIGEKYGAKVSGVDTLAETVIWKLYKPVHCFSVRSSMRLNGEIRSQHAPHLKSCRKRYGLMISNRRNDHPVLLSPETEAFLYGSPYPLDGRVCLTQQPSQHVRGIRKANT